MLDENLLHRRLISESEINESEIGTNVIVKESRNNDDSNISHGSSDNSPNSRLGCTNSPGCGVRSTSACDCNSRSACANDNLAELQLHQNSMDQDVRDRIEDLISRNRRSSSSSDVIECATCTFSTTVRTKFVQHLSEHCRTKRATSEINQEADTKNHSNCKENDNVSPAQEEHPDQIETEEAEEPGVRVPRLNSQGKLKTFPCKKCNFVANTKIEFWDHSRVHIRAEKLLNCPKCTFVTEYKHHLEYHLRNHVGSKPFKCTECKYTCVNKSMLNSHMKSHSNVYQYRCNDCPYATKYCHSLKLHLRKYNHAHAMVLNPDGTPNEDCLFIDIYGTKRGPKQKSKAYTRTHSDEMDQSSMSMANNNNNSDDNAQTDPIAAQVKQSPITIQLVTLDKTSDASDQASTQNDPIYDQPAYSQLLTAFDLSNQLMICGELKTVIRHTTKNESRTGSECSTEPEQRQLANNDHDTVDSVMFDDPAAATDGMTANLGEPSPMLVTPSPLSGETKGDDWVQSGPLDLTVTQCPGTSGSGGECQLTGNLPKFSGTRRRKGVAIKFVQRSTSQEQVLQETIRKVTLDEEKLSEASSVAGPSDIREAEQMRTENGNSSSKYFHCVHCEIIFRNELMHTIHMGYHGCEDPFVCKMCGEKCIDSASFFFHIGLCLFLRVLRTIEVQNRIINGLPQQIFHSDH